MRYYSKKGQAVLVYGVWSVNTVVIRSPDFLPKHGKQPHPHIPLEREFFLRKVLMEKGLHGTKSSSHRGPALWGTLGPGGLFSMGILKPWVLLLHKDLSPGRPLPVRTFPCEDLFPLRSLSLPMWPFLHEDATHKKIPSL